MSSGSGGNYSSTFNASDDGGSENENILFEVPFLMLIITIGKFRVTFNNRVTTSIIVQKAITTSFTV